jgi:hypothetical protein
MGIYTVTFERIGRTHNIPPQTFKADDGGKLAEHIHKFARKHLRSRDYDVDFNLADNGTGAGSILCGMHCGGRFTISAETSLAGA